MTITITLARNIHRDEEQADKLEEMIREADVISYEEQCGRMTFSAANEVERLFSTASAQKFTKVLKAIREQSTDPRETDYVLKLFQLIRAYKKNVVLIEQMDDEAAEICFRDDIASKRMQERSINDFFQGKFESAVNTTIQAVALLGSVIEFRDRLIIDYSPKALERAVAASHGEDVNYLIIIGQRHDIAQQLADKNRIAVRDIFIPGSPYVHLYPGDIYAPLIWNGDTTSTLVRDAIARGIAADLFRIVGLGASAVFYAVSHDTRFAQGSLIQPERAAAIFRTYYLEPLAFTLVESLSYGDLAELSSQLASNGAVINDHERI